MNELHATTDSLRNDRIAQIVARAKECIDSLSSQGNSREITELKSLIEELSDCRRSHSSLSDLVPHKSDVFLNGELCSVDWWKQEEELRVLRTAVEQNPSTIVITDLKGVIRYVNPAFEKTTGYSREEAIGLSPSVLKSGKQSRAFYQEMWTTLQKGNTWNGFFHNRKKDGSFFWELAVIAPLFNEARQMTGYIAIKQDMTPQKEAELRLKEVNASLIRMQRLYNQSSALAMIGSWEMDVATKRVQLSSITRRIWELPEDQNDWTLEEMLAQCKGGAHRATLRLAIERTVITCHSFDLELEIVTSKGSDRWIRVIGSGESLEGSCHFIYGAVQDITSQRNLQVKLESALAEERRQSRYIKDLTQSLPVAIFQKDIHGKVLNCNVALEVLTGFTREEILSVPIEQRYGKKISVTMEEEDRQLFKGEQFVFRNERTILHKDGHEIPVIVSKSLLHDENETVIGIVGAIIDITEIKALENEFRQATAEAERANRAKSNFLATMSHEIRTPLNAVVGMASLLEQTNIDDNQREYTRTIVSASETLLELISDILDYSKIESHKLELHNESFVFEDVFLEPINMFTQAAASKGIELSHYIDPSVPHILCGDRVRIKQILLNLLSNALKFTPAGEVSLAVEVKSKQAGQYELEFRVRDTGIGISKESQEILFQPFSQADSSITRHYGGTGLGLAICNQLVRLMGGHISVQSQLDFGSEFTFNIFLSEGELPKETPEKRDALKGRKMLVIDDMPINRQLLSAFGQKWGMTVTESDGVDSALAFLEAGQTFDCIVFDYLMPKMDGAELAERFQKNPKTASAKRILLSSINEASLQLPPGLFHAALTKPLRPSRLYDLLQTAFTQTTASNVSSIMESIDFTSIRILVAEDNLNNQTVIRLLLKQIGCSAMMVENGALAVEILEKNPFDIVILDVQMPVMDGITAMRLLDEKYANTADRPYFIALTANAFLEDEQFCLQAGFDRYMAKPVTLTQLREAIKLAKQPKLSE